MGYENLEMWDAMKVAKYRRTIDELESVISNAHTDINTAIAVSLNKVCDALHAEAGTFWVYSKYGDGLIRPKAVYGGEDIRDIYLLPGEGIAGECIDIMKSIVIENCREDDRWQSKVDDITGFETRTILCAPIICKGYCIGCVQVMNKKDGTGFDFEDRDFAESLADCIANSFVENNLLVDFKSYGQRGKKQYMKMLGGADRDVGILFVDIRNFSLLAKKIGNSKLADFLNIFLNFISDTITKNGGTVDKFMGDRVMAIWNAPEEVSDPVYRSAKAAVEMIKGMKELSRKCRKLFGVDVGFGIGINYGTCFVGNVGTANKMDYTAVGDVVNKAALIENKAPAGKILVSETVRDILADRCKFKNSGMTIQTKTKESNYVVYELLDVGDKR